MEGKKVGDVTVNDGKGLMDNVGMCDSLVNDCNTLVKYICTGNYILFCNLVSQMVVKLSNLQKGIQSDMDSMKEKVEELKRMNDSLFEQMTGLPVEKDGANDGSN